MLGVPCNQFGNQEPGSNAEILEFAQSTYDVQFPMFAKVDVNGADAHPVYEFLRQTADDDGNTDIGWNFTKFLVGADGQVIQRFAPMVTPEEIGAAIAAL